MMTIKDLKKEFEKYDDNVAVFFKLVPITPNEQNSDELDEDLDFMGEIGTSLLDSDNPQLEIGLKFPSAPCGNCESIQKINDIDYLGKDNNYQCPACK